LDQFCKTPIIPAPITWCSCLVVRSTWYFTCHCYDWPYSTLTVMASITEEIRKGNSGKKPGQGEEPSQKRPDLVEEPNQASEPGQGTNQPVRGILTREEWDSGTRSMSQKGSAELTGKLCHQVLALICWKVNTNRAVMSHMVQMLEEWLHRRGISIYTDLV
jgi:hypothetical protein